MEEAAIHIPAPRFSIVIPTYQRRDVVLTSVRALTRQELNVPFEVIVVVDGSTDGSVEALQGLAPPFPFTVLDQPNFGRASACNRGAAAARGEILLFLDDDMEAHPQLLSEHDRSHSIGADIVLGHIPLHPKSPPGLLSSVVKTWADRRCQRLSASDATFSLQDLITGQMSVKRETFKRIGGFDTGFTDGGSFGNEDIDLGYRLLQKNYKFVFNPNAISWQHYVVQPRQYLRQWRQAGRADVLFVGKYPNQAETTFHRAKRRLSRYLWRPLVSLPFVAIPVIAALRWLTIRLLESGVRGSLTTKLFFETKNLEYWQGVREAGDIPEPRPLRVLSYHAISDLTGFPVLERYGIPPEVFQDQLNTLLQLGYKFINGDEFLLLSHEGGLPRKALLLTFDDAYEDLLHIALPILKALRVPAIAFAVSGHLGRYNEWDRAIGAPQLRLLDVDGLQELARGGVEIGAHSRTHRPLTRVRAEELAEEIFGSVTELEAHGLCRPRFFAYPHGEWDLSVQEAAQRANLQAAFTVDAGLVKPCQNPYQIPRIEILKGDVGWKFRWKIAMAGASNLLSREPLALLRRLSQTSRVKVKGR